MTAPFSPPAVPLRKSSSTGGMRIQKTSVGWNVRFLGNRDPSLQLEVDQGFTAPTVYTARVEARNSVGSDWSEPVYYTPSLGNPRKSRTLPSPEWCFGWTPPTWMPTASRHLCGRRFGPSGWTNPARNTTPTRNGTTPTTYPLALTACPPSTMMGMTATTPPTKFNTTLNNGHTIFTFARYTECQCAQPCLRYTGRSELALRFPRWLQCALVFRRLVLSGQPTLPESFTLPTSRHPVWPTPLPTSGSTRSRYLPTGMVPTVTTLSRPIFRLVVEK